MIKLIEETHTYINDQYPDCKYTSVTTVLGKYKKPFDEKYHATRVAERKGVSIEEVISEWREINRIANEYGTSIHKMLERFLLTPRMLYIPRDDFEDAVIRSFKNICMSENLTLLDNDMLKPEHIMSIEFNKYKGIAGTSDIIEDLPNNTFNIWDFKTNKSFNYDSKYLEYLHFPVSHLQHCQYNDYTLQLSIYGVMYERETGKKLNRSGLFYWDKHNQTFKLIPVGYMKHEAEAILQDFELKHINKND